MFASIFLYTKITNKQPKKRILTRPLIYTSRITGTTITVPPLFSTDFASIPRALRPIFGVNYFAFPATVHDYLYKTASVSRKTADSVFYEACIGAGKSVILSKLAFAAVRAFGASHYKK